MTPDKWRRVKALFESAGGLSPDEQRELLDRECGSDSEVRAEVERLLQASDPPPEFLRPPIEGAALDLLAEWSKRPRPGDDQTRSGK